MLQSRPPDHASPTQAASGGDVDGVLAEIGTRLAAMRAMAATGGVQLLAPLLLLGTSERVGSNWLSDTLRPLMSQHNEPLRQQLGPDHPFSALNPEVGGQHFPGLPDPAQAHGCEVHWLVTCALGKYTRTRQVVKETNLFFAVELVLALFPDAPVAVLTRSPLGVASSFIRSDLFERWEYRARYQQMIATTRRPRWQEYAALVPDDDPSDLVALVRLQVLGTVLLAAAVTGRDVVQVPYETSVICRNSVLRDLATLLPDAGPGLEGAAAPGTDSAGAGEDTFVTTVAKTGLLAHLEGADAELVRSGTAAAMSIARQIVPAPVAARASAWLSGDHLYTLAARPPRTPRPTIAPPARPTSTVPAVAYLRREDISWRNLLVSNDEYAAFLNDLADAGLANDQAGTYLLAVPMPHERGGRLHRDPSVGRWVVSPGYGQHPAYWVTWIGAASFAACHGARLPRRAELIHEANLAGAPAVNSDYRHGDVTSVVEPGAAADQIHHLIGNLQVWCQDGPDPGQLYQGPLTRWLQGAAWNTPATPAEIHRPRDRHLAGASRGIGVRLVRDRDPATPVPVERLAALLTRWMISLKDRGLPLAALDGRLITALHRSQTDGGLGSLVRPGARETSQGQVPEGAGEPMVGQVGELDEVHAADRAGISIRQDISDVATDPSGLESQVHNMRAGTGQVVTHVEQAPDRDVDSGLLTHLADQRVRKRLAFLNFSSRQRPRAAGVGVLVEQQDLPVLDDHAGDTNLHTGESSPGGAL